MAMDEFRAPGEDIAKDTLGYLLYDCVLEDVVKGGMIPPQELCWSMGFVFGKPAVGIKKVKDESNSPIDDDG